MIELFGHGGYFDLDTVKTTVASLEVQMSASDFWNDTQNAQKVSKHAADLRNELSTWELFIGEIDELLELAKFGDEHEDTSMHDEIMEKLDGLEKRFAKMEFATLFSGSHDDTTAILAIHAGSGGTEAQDWAQMLLRMYSRFAEQKGFEMTILDESRAEDVGIKSIMVRVTGRYAYGYLKSEAGVHRLVRISPFDAEKMRHTTFALVEVIPELEEVEDLEIDPKDLRIDTYLSGGKGGQSVNTTYSAVRIVHLPTKIAVACQNERSQQQNKETAMKILRAKLYQLKLEEQKKQKSELRGEYQSAEWGNQIRSYVLHPYHLVKDHRTDYETTDTDAVLNGELDEFVEAYLRRELGLSDRFAKENKE
jgi:peptide chain release factor 2